MSSLAQFLSRRKPSTVRRTISAEELRIAYTQQQIAEEQWRISEQLNSEIARQLRNGAALDSDYDDSDYGFDPETERVIRKNRRDY